MLEIIGAFQGINPQLSCEMITESGVAGNLGGRSAPRGEPVQEGLDGSSLPEKINRGKM